MCVLIHFSLLKKSLSLIVWSVTTKCVLFIFLFCLFVKRNIFEVNVRALNKKKEENDIACGCHHRICLVYYVLLFLFVSILLFFSSSCMRLFLLTRRIPLHCILCSFFYCLSVLFIFVFFSFVIHFACWFLLFISSFSL